MFGLNYRKRCLAAEARVKDLEGALEVTRANRDHYRDLWLLLKDRQVRPAMPLTAAQTSRQAPVYHAQPSPVFVSAPPPPSFDITSAMVGAGMGYLLAGSSHHHAPVPAASPAFASGGGGDYGGGGASSSWESSSSSSSSDSSSASSYSSDSSSSSSSSSD